ncbi:MAG: type II toxin-antitoxin system prevent-host-death family antitoxin [Bifidobacteriaceae bacterium]|jgi:prevent-host-death family protein|nr:type II toxin-antitoxin system prevent-host-death family antitoxin [Bifidobacteriaceae bacterium]
MTAEPAEVPLITVGQLRQNPSQMIHEVRQGRSYVLTDRGVPTARIVPFQPDAAPVPLSTVLALINLPPDAAWDEDRRGFREGFDLADPWDGAAE